VKTTNFIESMKNSLDIGNKKALIIGRSPFVNLVKWDKIDFTKYFVICINYPVSDIPVDIVIARDDTPNPVLAPATLFISPKTGYNFTHETKSKEDIEFHCYTSSSAVFLAHKLGFKEAYLIGIDHIEDNKPFSHYDGIINKGIATAEANRLCNAYICSFKDKMSIYQTNPNAKGWDLPYKKIEDLY
jgi:hypothetical protein